MQSFWPMSVLRSESVSGKCPKLHTVAATNNRDHMPWSLYSCLFMPHVYRCYSLRTSRSWRIAHSTQRQLRGCNIWNALEPETSWSLDIIMPFHRCKNHFPLLAYDNNNNLNCAVFPGYSLERKADIVNMCKRFLSIDNKRCRDYKELMLLALFYLPQRNAVSWIFIIR